MVDIPTVPYPPYPHPPITHLFTGCRLRNAAPVEGTNAESERSSCRKAPRRRKIPLQVAAGCCGQTRPNRSRERSTPPDGPADVSFLQLLGLLGLGCCLRVSAAQPTWAQEQTSSGFVLATQGRSLADVMIRESRQATRGSRSESDDCRCVSCFVPRDD